MAALIFNLDVSFQRQVIAATIAICKSSQ